MVLSIIFLDDRFQYLWYGYELNTKYTWLYPYTDAPNTVATYKLSASIPAFSQVSSDYTLHTKYHIYVAELPYI